MISSISCSTTGANSNEEDGFSLRGGLGENCLWDKGALYSGLSQCHSLPQRRHC
ncbi:hypothetical protein J6590_097929 [Homalodisca vitripennis]|nr:hypothetical protein J6590_097929 [Homalodisca vitripennis]